MLRRIFNGLVGLMAIYVLGNKLMTCPMCEGRIFGFEIPGIAYLGIWAFVLYSCINQERMYWSAGRR